MLRRFLAVVAILVMGFSLLPAQSVALPPSPQVDQWNEGPVPVRAVGESDADFQARIDAWIMRAINRLTWNCYNYGVNVQTVRNLGIAVRAHPGTGMAWPNLGAAITDADMCTKTRNRAINDGLHAVAWNGPRPGFPLGDPIPTPPVGENLVALG